MSQHRQSPKQRQVKPEPTCEHYQGKKKQQQQKRDYYARNPHLKWGK